MDAGGIERAHLIGNSMGGRVAFEVGFRNADRVEPDRRARRRRWRGCATGRWTPLVKALRPELGLLQITPRPVIEQAVRRFVPGGRDGWSAVGVDEFLRAYMQPRGRAAFYAALRNIYLDEPEGDEGFWTRLRALEHESLFVWGRQDRLVPIAFARHVREALPGAQHVELDCGHVPQLEAPRETHAAISGSSRGAERRRLRQVASSGRRRAGRVRPRLRESRPATLRPLNAQSVEQRSASASPPPVQQHDPRPQPAPPDARRNGRRRSRASRRFPRTKSTRRTSRVPPPITRTRARSRPEPPHVQPQPPQPAPPAGPSPPARPAAARGRAAPRGRPACRRRRCRPGRA